MNYQPIIFAIGLGTLLIWFVSYVAYDWALELVSRYAGVK